MSDLWFSSLRSTFARNNLVLSSKGSKVPKVHHYTENYLVHYCRRKLSSWDKRPLPMIGQDKRPLLMIGRYKRPLMMCGDKRPLLMIRDKRPLAIIRDKRPLRLSLGKMPLGHPTVLGLGRRPLGWHMHQPEKPPPLVL